MINLEINDVDDDFHDDLEGRMILHIYFHTLTCILSQFHFHFHSHTSTFTLSLSLFHLHTFTLTLSLPNFHTSTFTIPIEHLHTFTNNKAIDGDDYLGGKDAG